MQEPQPATGSTQGRLRRSFIFAWRGLAVLLRSQANARIHAAATAAVISAGFLLRLARWEWCAVIAAIGLVWTSEALNTALEAAVDLATPQQHPLAGRAKDLAAAAVLCAALAAAVIGAVVFAPHLLALR